MYRNIETLSIEKIQEKVSDYNLFKYYAGNFTLKKPISSPLREDKKPSFCIYPYGSSIKFKDFSTGEHGSVFDFVMLKFKCNFAKALEIINKDFKDKFRNSVRKDLDKIVSIKSEVIIEIKKRKWSFADKKFWGLYGLDPGTLEKFNIFPVSHVWLTKEEKRNLIIYPRNGDIHYAYRFGNRIYKIYSPLSKRKWISNAKSFHIQGYDQLSSTGRLLIITKSLKDVLVLYTLGFSSVAPQSESNFISEKLIEELKKRFKKILTFYDDDEAGNQGAKRLLKYNIPSIKLKKCDDYKDISDFIKFKGREEALKIMQELIIFKGLINFLN